MITKTDHVCDQPNCGRGFASMRLLGLHKFSKHGIHGKNREANQKYWQKKHGKNSNNNKIIPSSEKPRFPRPRWGSSTSRSAIYNREYRKVLKARKAGEVGVELFKIRRNKRTKVKDQVNVPAVAAPLCFCPSCGTDLRGIQMALNIGKIV